MKLVHMLKREESKYHNEKEAQFSVRDHYAGENQRVIFSLVLGEWSLEEEA